MHPVILKLYFQPVFRIGRIILVLGLYLIKNAFYIKAPFKFNFVFTYKIIGVGAT